MEALEGGKIGHYTYEVENTYQETSEEYNYQSASGIMVRIEDVSALPANVKPEDQVELGATYALLDAAPDADIKITEIREIRYEGDLVGRPKVSLTHKGGSYSSTVPLFLPKDAKTGTYKDLTAIQAPNASDSGEKALPSSSSEIPRVYHRPEECSLGFIPFLLLHLQGKKCSVIRHLEIICLTEKSRFWFAPNR